MNTEFKKNPGEVLKIGARVLHEEQAKIILPTYEKLATQVSDFRKQAYNHQINKKNESDNLLKSKEFTSDFNNVISILGQRGTGKSSVMMTFKYHHSYANSKSDIILPLIDPDQMSNASHALGWVISFLQNEMNNINNLYKKKLDHEGIWVQEKFCDKEDKNPLDKAYFELQKAYLLRQESYIDIIRKRDEGILEHIRDNEKIINYDRQLIDLFHKFIDKIIEVKKEMNDRNVEPLILIFFDDVDISAGRCVEVLDTIRVFFSHPNIVTFVSGQYNVFLEAITIHMLNEEKISEHHYKTQFITGENISALEYRNERSKEYLKKVFSPAFRFDMKSQLSNIEKQNFKYYISQESSENAITLNQLIEEIKFESISDKNNGNLEYIPENYFSIFDDNPRGLINVYYFLYQRKAKLWHAEDVIQFLQIIINSSSILSQFNEEIDNILKINMKENNIDYNLTRIDYSNLKITARFDMSFDFDKEELRNKLILFLLASFFEKLLTCLDPQFKINKNIKNHKLIELFNKLFLSNSNNAVMLESVNLFPNINNEIEILNLYQKLKPLLQNLYRPIFNFERSLQTNDYFLERKYIELLSNNDENQFYDFLKKMYNSDNVWIENIINYISKVGQTESDRIQKIINEVSHLRLYWADDYRVLNIDNPVNIDILILEQSITNLRKRLQKRNLDDLLDRIKESIFLIKLFNEKQELQKKIINFELELKELSNQKINLEQDVADLNYNRWLKKPEKLKKVIEEFKRASKKVNEYKKQKEIPELIEGYFIEEILKVDREDINNYVENETLAYTHFENFLEGSKVIYEFYPLEILKNYLDNYQIKQFSKKNKLELTALVYFNEEDHSDISDEQIVKVQDYYNALKRSEILELLLPLGETTSGADFSDYNLKISSINNEIKKTFFEKSILEKESAEREKNFKFIVTELFDTKFLENILSSFDYNNITTMSIDRFSENLINKLVDFYNEYENRLFINSYESISNNAINTFNDNDLRLNHKPNLEEIYLIVKEIIFSRKNLIKNSDDNQKEILKKIIEKAEFSPLNEHLLFPSLKLYSNLKFTLDKNELIKDQKNNGELFFFISTKLFLQKKSQENFTPFNLFLKRLLDSRQV